MASPADEAKALITSVPLTPMGHRILCEFLIGESHFPDCVADEVLRRALGANGIAAAQVLKSVKDDWHSILKQGECHSLFVSAEFSKLTPATT